MTQKELYQVAEEAWEGCDGCDENDKAMWINGFVRSANLFAQVETLPSPGQLEKKGQVIAEKLKSHLEGITKEQFEKEIGEIASEGYTSGPTMEEFIANQKALDPEYQQIIAENFWDLVDDGKSASPYCPICQACGEDGCCRATACQQHPDGDYCKEYLKDLKFAYVMNNFFENEISEQLPFYLREKYNAEWDQQYDKIYNGKK